MLYALLRYRRRLMWNFISNVLSCASSPEDRYLVSYQICPSENWCQQEPASCLSIISSSPNVHITDAQLNKLESSVHQLTSTSFPNVSHHHEGAQEASTATADDRFKRPEDILTALIKSVINKNISNSSPAECNEDKVQNETLKTTINSENKINYIPFTEPLGTSDGSYARFYTIKFNEEDKRKINPYLLRNEITNFKATGNKWTRLVCSGGPQQRTRK